MNCQPFEVLKWLLCASIFMGFMVNRILVFFAKDTTTVTQLMKAAQSSVIPSFTVCPAATYMQHVNLTMFEPSELTTRINITQFAAESAARGRGTTDILDEITIKLDDMVESAFASTMNHLNRKLDMRSWVSTGYSARYLPLPLEKKKIRLAFLSGLKLNGQIHRNLSILTTLKFSSLWF